MTIHNSLAELIATPRSSSSNHIPQAARRQSHHRRQSRILQPRWIFQGPHCRTHHRRRRTVRPTEARRRDRRTHLRQHRRRPGPGRPAARLPHDFHPAGPRSPNPSARCCAPTVPKSSSRQPTPARTTRAPTIRSPNDWPIRFPAASARTSTTIRTAAEPLLHHRT